VAGLRDRSASLRGRASHAAFRKFSVARNAEFSGYNLVFRNYARRLRPYTLGKKDTMFFNIYSITMSALKLAHANEIIPGLWLGDMYAALNPQFIIRNRINVVVNCTPLVPFLDIASVVHKYRVAIDDIMPCDDLDARVCKQVAMVRAIRKMMPIIEQHHRGDDQILIHCVAGMQRSAIMMMSYLYDTQVCDAGEAYAMIKARRPIAFAPRINFAPAFRFAFAHRLRQ
jgi:hypothetical protein